MATFVPLNRYLLIVVLAVAFTTLGIALRFQGVGERIYWNDEVMTLVRISGRGAQTVTKEVRHLNGEVNSTEIVELQLPPSGDTLSESVASIWRRSFDSPPHLPLYYPLVRLWMELDGKEAVSSRHFSVLLGICAIFGTAGFIRSLGYGDSASIITAILAACSPYLIIYSQEARMYMLAMLLMLAASFLLFKLSAGRPRILPLYGLICLAGILTHPIFILHFAGHGLYLFCGTPPEDKLRRKSRLLLIWGALAFLIAVCSYPWYSRLISTAEYTHHYTKTELVRSELFSRWLNEWPRLFFEFHKLTGAAEWRWYLAIAGLLPIIVALAYGLRHIRRSEVKLIFCVFLLPGLFFVASDLALGHHRSTIVRYLLPPAVGVILLLAILLSEYGRYRTARAVVLTLLIAGSGLASSYQVADILSWNRLPPINSDIEAVTFLIGQQKKGEAVKLITRMDEMHLLSLSHSLPEHIRIENIPRRASAEGLLRSLAESGENARILILAGRDEEFLRSMRRINQGDIRIAFRGAELTLHEISFRPLRTNGT